MKAFALVAMGVLLTVSAQAADKRRAAPKRTTTYDSYETRASSGAASGHRMAGCGLGSMVVEDSNKWAQVGAAFLNGTGMQTFGISFGTSNCTEDGVATAEREKDAFVEANLADLRRDVAAGEGEYLSSAANLYGCESLGASLNREEFLKASAAEASDLLDAAAARCGS